MATVCLILGASPRNLQAEHGAPFPNLGYYKNTDHSCLAGSGASSQTSEGVTGTFEMSVWDRYQFTVVPDG